MGPQGMVEVSEAITSRVQYAIRSLSAIAGVGIRFPGSAHFREVVVDFSQSGRSVSEINRLLLERGIFGGCDLGRAFPQFKDHAIYCVTEVHTKEDIDALARNLTEVLS
jgi:glycine dehydrogenase subunit 1